MLFKSCFKCGATLSEREFYKHPHMADGYLNKCKSCTKSDVAQHRIENLDRIRAYDKRRGKLPHRVALNTKNTKKYRRKFTKRYRAYSLVAHAVRNGRLKPEPCFICGEKALAHHPDYDQPLDVVWLCQVHHKAAHAMV